MSHAQDSQRQRIDCKHSNADEDNGRDDDPALENEARSPTSRISPYRRWSRNSAEYLESYRRCQTHSLDTKSSPLAPVPQSMSNTYSAFPLSFMSGDQSSGWMQPPYEKTKNKINLTGHRFRRSSLPLSVSHSNPPGGGTRRLQTHYSSSSNGATRRHSNLLFDVLPDLLRDDERTMASSGPLVGHSSVKRLSRQVKELQQQLEESRQENTALRVSKESSQENTALRNFLSQSQDTAEEVWELRRRLEGAERKLLLLQVTDNNANVHGSGLTQALGTKLMSAADLQGGGGVDRTTTSSGLFGCLSPVLGRSRRSSAVYPDAR
ncbi:hypothetical protein CEUSTIGMA_g12457.t1 [Chlamydomonas eustigma]|uniref:Uncharacterized protein n=1 Tax=Chlamydomonas eustigma TaxID=1157962 RepID=A0A250XPN8_9CHLO|nr:hypothetical protein CEUSTIGMA_g12457.t1 [Chlamydomonas eustigma]|eukprot:GAX85037.1 hypothetical protein CEUSTIGMA_g12457.t1 [Chlamydomonas eustigma]